MSAQPLANPRLPWLLAGAVLVVGLVAAPRVFHNYDVVDCFLAWSRATEGTRPWRVYTPGVGADDCDYPALVPYALTLVEGARLAAGAPPVGPLAVSLLKLPSLLSLFLAVPVALGGLRRRLGEDGARMAAILLATSPAWFVNAALWGQFDVPLARLMVGAVLALLAARPVLAGVVTGLALSTKLLAIVPVPLLALWVWRRQGWRALARASAAALLVVLLLALPHVLAGRGRAMLRAYTGAVGYYPYRTVEAYNTWYLLDRYDVLVRGLSPPEARRDDRPALGPLTFHHLGLGVLAVYSFALLVVLWRRPMAPVLLWCAALQLFGFFMLPTQVHQRYIVPVVGLLALVACGSRRGWPVFVGVTVTATLNQALDLVRALPAGPLPWGALAAADLPLATRMARDLGAGVALANVLLFAWALLAFRKDLAEEAEVRGLEPP